MTAIIRCHLPINVNRIMTAIEFLNKEVFLIWFGLVWFYGILTIVRYLMPDPIYAYIYIYIYIYIYSIIKWRLKLG